tara:strand:+ start:528 stop:2138 length:1611 start_codon:yes stop_codon:yes gene_type:complete
MDGRATRRAMEEDDAGRRRRRGDGASASASAAAEEEASENATNAVSRDGEAVSSSSASMDETDEEEEEEEETPAMEKKLMPTTDRGLGQRRALSAETRSRPFVPLKGEVLHIAWYREYDETGKFTREEGMAHRKCIEELLAHYTMPMEKVEETLDGIERGWSDVTLNLGGGFNLRMQRHTEFETLTLNGPGNMKAALGTKVTPWQWLLPPDWLSQIPGKVFLVNHAVFRQLSQAPKTRVPSLKELNDIRRTLGSSGDAKRGETDATEIEDNAAMEWDAGSLVGCDIGDGSRMFANYELDEFGAMSTLVVVPPGEATFIRAGRQLQRFFALEQYRLLILQRLPNAKSKFQLLAGLNERYEALSRELRRSKATSRGHKDQQNFVTQITELEEAITQLVTRTKLVALTVASYLELIDLRLGEAGFTRLGYEIRFLPLFVKKRIDPAVSTINAVAEQAKILSDALERTTSLVQASVEVRLQRINERIATYGLLFTSLSVFVTFMTSIQPNGSLYWLYVFIKTKFAAWAAFCARACAGAPA